MLNSNHLTGVKNQPGGVCHSPAISSRVEELSGWISFPLAVAEKQKIPRSNNQKLLFFHNIFLLNKSCGPNFRICRFFFTSTEANLDWWVWNPMCKTVFFGSSDANWVMYSCNFDIWGLALTKETVKTYFGSVDLKNSLQTSKTYISVGGMECHPCKSNIVALCAGKYTRCSVFFVIFEYLLENFRTTNLNFRSSDPNLKTRVQKSGVQYTAVRTSKPCCPNSAVYCCLLHLLYLLQHCVPIHFFHKKNNKKQPKQVF